MGEFAAAAHGNGLAVVYGRCDEELAVPYQPWIEAMREVVRHLPEDALVEHTTRYGGELARLVPELTTRVEGLPEPRRADAETERFLLFDAVAGALALVARDAPVVLVLDDLHWADRPSLLLLRHLVRNSDPMPVLLLATYRDTDVAAGAPLTELNAQLHREPGVERIKLEGLDGLGVGELVDATVTEASDDDGALASALLRETKGNPFFLTELLHHLAETGALRPDSEGRLLAGEDVGVAGLPESVRQVVGERIQRLGPDAARVLAYASVIGRDFDLALLSRVTELGEEDLVDLLDDGLRASVIEEVPTNAGLYTFAHALICHTLYEDLSATRRRLLHRRVGEALEELYAADPGDRIGELARHWCEATQPADVEKALRFSLLAGDAAAEALAHDEAVAALLAVGFLFSRIGDPGEFWDSIRGASWGFVALAFVLGMSTDAAFGVTFLGNVPMRIPVWPSIELQSAMSFSNLAVPVAADTALQVRFLQKQGLDLPSAVATGGVLSTVSEIAVQIGLLFVALWLAPDAIEFGRIDSGQIVVVALIAVFAILVALAIVLGVRRVRRAVLPPVAQAARTMWAAMRSPGRIALLIGGNVVAQCLYAGSLLACLHAFGATVDFWTLVALNIGISTIASLVPLPGGGTAAVLTHQLAVSYLPAIPGWFATQDLVHKGRL